MSTGYDFGRDTFPELLLRKFFPERTDRESGVLRDYLVNHLHEYERVSFSVHIGQGNAPNPDHLPGVQKQTVLASQKRIDLVGWRARSVDIVDAKERIRAEVLGQLRLYRHLWLEENPDAEEPRLVAIGRYSDDDTLRALRAEGIDVYLYAPDAVG